MRWHEVRQLRRRRSPADRAFIDRTDDDGEDGRRLRRRRAGARVPTGVENVTAVYRTGIGKAGNVGAGQISLLATRPLGVKDVVNPLRASGGADREDRDQARGQRAAGRAWRSTGWSRCATTRISPAPSPASARPPRPGCPTDGGRSCTSPSPGADDIPIEPTSDLYPQPDRGAAPVRRPVTCRSGSTCASCLALVIERQRAHRAGLRLGSVEPRIRAALLDASSASTGASWARTLAAGERHRRDPGGARRRLRGRRRLRHGLRGAGRLAGLQRRRPPRRWRGRERVAVRDARFEGRQALAAGAARLPDARTCPTR